MALCENLTVYQFMLIHDVLNIIYGGVNLSAAFERNSIIIFVCKCYFKSWGRLVRRLETQKFDGNSAENQQISKAGSRRSAQRSTKLLNFHVNANSTPIYTTARGACL